MTGGLGRPIEPAEVYHARARMHGEARDRLRAHSTRLSAVRAAVFVAAAVLLFLGAWPGLGGGATALLGALALGLLFIGLVIHHERIECAARELEVLVRINEHALARLARDWQRLPEPPPLAAPEHPYAEDLGVVGHASLWHLLGGIPSAHGRGTLGAWLLAPAAPATVRERQAAVAELAPMVELREGLQAGAHRLSSLGTAGFSRFLGWAEDTPWLTAAAWRPLLVRVLTALILGLAALHAAGAVAQPLWLLPMAAGWLLTARWRPRAERAFVRADPGGRLFEHYPPLFRLVGETPFTDPALAEIGRRLGGAGAPAALERLHRALAVADARHMWLHFVLQSLTLWDFHALIRLERWQRRWGREARGWFEALGELEALSALAALRFDHASWTLPDVAAEASALEAEMLAHPLLPPGGAVGNDVRVGPAGTFLLVTGSNMSGKSTLLRAIGLGAVLAQAGAPVPARRLRLPTLAVATCMQVHDSLERGVSYFMAELLRLKAVVDAAEADAGTLYLLDEILQGTNTAERQVAARHVIERLVASGAIGAVSTHDLALADASELRDAAVPVHFQETVREGDAGEGAMTFDYRLRPGVATSVNALRLLRIAGL